MSRSKNGKDQLKVSQSKEVRVTMMPPLPRREQVESVGRKVTGEEIEDIDKSEGTKKRMRKRAAPRERVPEEEK